MSNQGQFISSGGCIDAVLGMTASEKKMRDSYQSGVNSRNGYPAQGYDGASNAANHGTAQQPPTVMLSLLNRLIDLHHQIVNCRDTATVNHDHLSATMARFAGQAPESNRPPGAIKGESSGNNPAILPQIEQRLNEIAYAIETLNGELQNGARLAECLARIA